MKNKYSDLLKSLTNEPRVYNSSILLVDGLNTFLRCFAVINHVNSLGSHIGGLTGFLKSIGYAIKITNPTRVIILFDGVGGSSARKNLYPGYKANRGINRMTNYSIFSTKEEEQESIENQIERLIQYLKCLPIGLLSIDGLEADDIIGYMAEHFSNQKDCSKVTIMSADQDFLQLVNDKIEVYSPVKKKFYDKKRILEEYNISSNNFLIMKTLLGDSSDNLPGIDGLGPKKLIKFFPELAQENEFNLSEVYNKSKEGQHKIHDRIIERKHQLDINYIIMNLKNLPLSEGNKKIIEEVIFEQPNKLNQQGFVSMYNSDKLNESIPYVEKWLLEVFSQLTLFTNTK